MKLKHNRFLSLVFLLSAFFYFSANCQAQRLPEETMRFHKDYTENGLIFGTITFPREKLRFDGTLLQVDYLTGDKKMWRKNSNKIKIGPTMFKGKHNGELEGGKTYLFAMEKPPGPYTIDWLRFVVLKVGDYNSQTSDIVGFSIPFNVNKGEITYVGEIKINEYAENGEPVITINDAFERDKNAMKDLQKMVNWDSAVKSKLEIIRGDVK